jgi:hypothetical protein
MYRHLLIATDGSAKAVEDIASLRLPILGTDHMQYAPATGRALVRGAVRPGQLNRLFAKRAGLP